jgi:hypothetical protein
MNAMWKLKKVIPFICLIMLVILAFASMPAKALLPYGPHPVVVILVEFPDLQHSVSRDEINNRVFTTLNEYFKDASYGKLSLTGVTTSKWYMMPNPYSYYVAKEASYALLFDAVKAADDDIDFRQFQHLIIVHAGDNAMRTFTLGKNLCTFYSRGTIPLSTKDGQVNIGVVGVSEMDPIGPYANAFLFNLGLISLFDASVKYPEFRDNFVGEWDVMAHGFWANNGSTPVQPSSWSKLKLGWIEPSQVKTITQDSSADVMIAPLSSQLPKGAYYTVKIPLKNGTYYLVEARERVKWDQYLPDEGIAIYLCDDRKGSGEGAVKLVSANPPSLDYASAWKVGSEYFDGKEVVRIRVLEKVNGSYKVNVAVGSATIEYPLVIKGPYANIPVKVGEKTYTTDKNGEVRLKLSSGRYKISIAPMIQLNETARAIFLSWSNGDKSNTTTVDVFEPTRIEANYRLQYFLSVKSDYGEANGSGWYDEGASAEISVLAPFDHGNGTRRVFIGWSGDYEGTSPSATVTVDKPKVIVANWKKQFKLTINSEYGAPSGAGWYDEGTWATISIQDVAYDGNTRYVFLGWDFNDKNPKTKILMDSPKTISTIWKIQYNVSMKVLDRSGSVLRDISFIEFMAPNGSSVIFKQETTAWLDEGNWTLTKIMYHGVDVKFGLKTYSPKPGVLWEIPAQVYSLTVRVLSSLTGWPVQGATVSITLPDGLVVSKTTNEKGEAIFTNLPPFMYEVKVSGNNRVLQLVSNEDAIVQLKITTLQDELLTIAVVLAVGITMLFLVLKLRKIRLKTAKPNL